MALTDHAKGYLITLAGVAVITPDTLLIRLAAVDPFTLLETVIGPFWVWLVLAEEPGIRSLVGGAVIITALFLHALIRLQIGRRA